ncbi:hypothetical protein D3C77_541870 [compost metagenome]
MQILFIGPIGGEYDLLFLKPKLTNLLLRKQFLKRLCHRRAMLNNIKASRLFRRLRHITKIRQQIGLVQRNQYVAGRTGKTR